MDGVVPHDIVIIEAREQTATHQTEARVVEDVAVDKMVEAISETVAGHAADNNAVVAHTPIRHSPTA